MPKFHEWSRHRFKDDADKDAQRQRRKGKSASVRLSFYHTAGGDKIRQWKVFVRDK